jgi:hypothetical protein
VGEMATEKPWRCKSPDSNSCRTESSRRYIMYSVCIRYNVKLYQQWNKPITEPIEKKGDKMDCIIIEAHQHYKYIKIFVGDFALKVNSNCRQNYWGLSMWILT